MPDTFFINGGVVSSAFKKSGWAEACSCFGRPFTQNNILWKI